MKVKFAITITCLIGTIVLFSHLISLSSFAEESTLKAKKSECAGKQWEQPGDRLDCMYPYPPIGRWHAVYTKAFAEEHNLPSENISTDFSSGVDYMEMQVLPYGKGGAACVANMLIKKPHDVALYKLGKETTLNFFQDRKLLNLKNVDLENIILSPITTIGLIPRNYQYNSKNAMGRGGSSAFYAENILPDYDLISANANCRWISMQPDLYPNNYAFWAAKASRWGKYKALFTHVDDFGRPSGREFYDSHFFINIPEELVLNIFKNVPIGGR